MDLDCLVLPVAPDAMAQVRFTANRNPPAAIQLKDSINWIRELIKGGKRVKTVDLNGPGEPMKSPDILIKTLDMLGQTFPEMEVRITSLGLGAAEIATTLVAKGVKHINIKVDAIDPGIANKIYGWIRPAKKTVPLAQAIDILIEGQQDAVAALSAAGIFVNIETRVYPDINDRHIESIAQKMAELGADSITLVPYITEQADEEPLSCNPKILAAAQESAASHLKVIKYNKYEPPPPTGANFDGSTTLPRPTKSRPNVAVASSNGMDIDLHLGHAWRLLIYGPRSDGLPSLLDTRLVPEFSPDNSRWQHLAQECLDDCFAILVANAGDNPQNVLSELGIKVLITEDNIEGTIDILYENKKQRCKK